MKLLRITLFIAISILFSNCSLLKFSIETGAEPLTARQLSTRILVRNFVEEIGDDIEKTADSIIAETAHAPLYQINAIRWKMNAGTAYTKAGYQTIPESSLTDVWVLSLQWKQLMDTQADSLLGDYGYRARGTTQRIARKMDEMARKINDGADYRKLKAFAESYAMAHPLPGFSTQAPKTLKPLLDHLELPDTAYTRTIGTQAEVWADFGDRLGRYQNQLGNTLEWEKDRMSIWWEQGDLDEKLLARADSLALLLDNLATIAEESPEMMGIIAVRMSEELSPLVFSMNATLTNALEKLDVQRDSLQIYFDEQRAILTKELEQTGNSMIETATDGLVKLIRQVIVYVILLVCVLFGVPFALGYSLGRMRLRQKKDKESGSQ